MFKIQLEIFAIVFLPFASQYTQFTDLQTYTLYMHKTYTHYVHMYNKEKLGQDRSACYYESLVCWEIWFSWLLLIAGCLLYLKMYPWVCLSVGAQDSWGDYLKKTKVSLAPVFTFIGGAVPTSFLKLLSSRSPGYLSFVHSSFFPCDIIHSRTRLAACKVDLGNHFSSRGL